MFRRKLLLTQQQQHQKRCSSAATATISRTRGALLWCNSSSSKTLPDLGHQKRCCSHGPSLTASFSRALRTTASKTQSGMTTTTTVSSSSMLIRPARSQDHSSVSSLPRVVYKFRLPSATSSCRQQQRKGAEEASNLGSAVPHLSSETDPESQTVSSTSTTRKHAPPTISPATTTPGSPPSSFLCDVSVLCEEISPEFHLRLFPNDRQQLESLIDSPSTMPSTTLTTEATTTVVELSSSSSSSTSMNLVKIPARDVIIHVGGNQDYSSSSPPATTSTPLQISASCYSGLGGKPNVVTFPSLLPEECKLLISYLEGEVGCQQFHQGGSSSSEVVVDPSSPSREVVVEESGAPAVSHPSATETTSTTTTSKNNGVGGINPVDNSLDNNAKTSTNRQQKATTPGTEPTTTSSSAPCPISVLCPQSHILHQVDDLSIARRHGSHCDRCRQPIVPSTTKIESGENGKEKNCSNDCFFRCHECDFDMCASCWSAEATNAATSSDQKGRSLPKVEEKEASSSSKQSRSDDQSRTTTSANSSPNHSTTTSVTPSASLSSSISCNCSRGNRVSQKLLTKQDACKRGSCCDQCGVPLISVYDRRKQDTSDSAVATVPTPPTSSDDAAAVVGMRCDECDYDVCLDCLGKKEVVEAEEDGATSTSDLGGETSQHSQSVSPPPFPESPSAESFMKRILQQQIEEGSSSSSMSISIPPEVNLPPSPTIESSVDMPLQDQPSYPKKAKQEATLGLPCPEGSTAISPTSLALFNHCPNGHQLSQKEVKNKHGEGKGVEGGQQEHFKCHVCKGLNNEINWAPSSVSHESKTQQNNYHCCDTCEFAMCQGCYDSIWGGAARAAAEATISKAAENAPYNEENPTPLSELEKLECKKYEWKHRATNLLYDIKAQTYEFKKILYAEKEGHNRELYREPEACHRLSLQLCLERSCSNRELEAEYADILRLEKELNALELKYRSSDAVGESSSTSGAHRKLYIEGLKSFISKSSLLVQVLLAPANDHLMEVLREFRHLFPPVAAGSATGLSLQISSDAQSSSSPASTTSASEKKYFKTYSKSVVYSPHWTTTHSAMLLGDVERVKAELNSLFPVSPQPAATNTDPVVQNRDESSSTPQGGQQQRQQDFLSPYHLAAMSREAGGEIMRILINRDKEHQQKGNEERTASSDGFLRVHQQLSRRVVPVPPTNPLEESAVVPMCVACVWGSRPSSFENAAAAKAILDFYLEAEESFGSLNSSSYPRIGIKSSKSDAAVNGYCSHTTWAWDCWDDSIPETANVIKELERFAGMQQLWELLEATRGQKVKEQQENGKKKEKKEKPVTPLENLQKIRSLLITHGSAAISERMINEAESMASLWPARSAALLPKDGSSSSVRESHEFLKHNFARDILKLFYARKRLAPREEELVDAIRAADVNLVRRLVAEPIEAIDKGWAPLSGVIPPAANIVVEDLHLSLTFSLLYQRPHLDLIRDKEREASLEEIRELMLASLKKSRESLQDLKHSEDKLLWSKPQQPPFSPQDRSSASAEASAIPEVSGNGNDNAKAVELSASSSVPKDPLLSVSSPQPSRRCQQHEDGMKVSKLLREEPVLRAAWLKLKRRIKSERKERKELKDQIARLSCRNRELELVNCPHGGLKNVRWMQFRSQATRSIAAFAWFCFFFACCWALCHGIVSWWTVSYLRQLTKNDQEAIQTDNNKKMSQEEEEEILNQSATQCSPSLDEPSPSSSSELILTETVTKMDEIDTSLSTKKEKEVNSLSSSQSPVGEHQEEEEDKLARPLLHHDHNSGDTELYGATSWLRAGGALILIVGAQKLYGLGN